MTWAGRLKKWNGLFLDEVFRGPAIISLRPTAAGRKTESYPVWEMLTCARGKC
jgi:hypothetical protein